MGIGNRRRRGKKDGRRRVFNFKSTHSRRIFRGRGPRRAPWLARRRRERVEKAKKKEKPGDVFLSFSLFFFSFSFFEEEKKWGRKNEWLHSLNLLFPLLLSLREDGIAWLPLYLRRLSAAVSSSSRRAAKPRRKRQRADKRERQRETRTRRRRRFFSFHLALSIFASFFLPSLLVIAMYSNFKEKAIGKRVVGCRAHGQSEQRLWRQRV
jgi:hypothetical protein